MANPTKSDEIATVTGFANTYLPATGEATTAQLTSFYAACCGHFETTHPDNSYPPVRVKKV